MDGGDLQTGNRDRTYGARYLSLLGTAPDDLAWYSTSKTHSQKKSPRPKSVPLHGRIVFISFFAPKITTKSILKYQTSGNPLPPSIRVLHNIKVTLPPPPLLIDASTPPSLDPVAVRNNLRVARSSGS